MAYSYSAAGGAGVGGLNLTTVTHELAHQLAFNSGLQSRNVRYPFWLTEGLATNFEADSSGAYGFGRTSSNYTDRLVVLGAGGRLMPLDQLLTMTQPPAGGDQTIRDAYAQAWGLFNYLFRYRRTQLRTFMTGMKWSRFDGQTRGSRFVEAFGPVASVEHGFRNYVRSLGGGSR